MKRYSPELIIDPLVLDESIYHPDHAEDIMTSLIQNSLNQQLDMIDANIPHMLISPDMLDVVLDLIDISTPTEVNETLVETILGFNYSHDIFQAFVGTKVLEKMVKKEHIFTMQLLRRKKPYFHPKQLKTIEKAIKYQAGIKKFINVEIDFNEIEQHSLEQKTEPSIINDIMIYIEAYTTESSIPLEQIDKILDTERYFSRALNLIKNLDKSQSLYINDFIQSKIIPVLKQRPDTLDSLISATEITRTSTLDQIKSIINTHLAFNKLKQVTTSNRKTVRNKI